MRAKGFPDPCVPMRCGWSLRQDPRPSYQEDPSRLYGVPFAGQDVRFTVEGDVLTVREIGAVPGPQIQEG